MKASTTGAAVLVTGLAVLALGVGSTLLAGTPVEAPPVAAITATQPGDGAQLAEMTDSLLVPGGRMVISTPETEEPVAGETPSAGTPSNPGIPSRPGPVAPPSNPAPPAPPVVEPPAPHVVDHTPRFRHNSNYTPGCNGADMAFKYSQEMSEGGTSVITVPYLYDVSTYSTANGFGVKVYICDL